MKKKHIYIIESGDFKKEQIGEQMFEAGVLAFKNKAPKNPALLTRIKRKGGNQKMNGEYIWHYIDSTVLLKKAGYKIKS